jgi:hypothetical protein
MAGASFSAAPAAQGQALAVPRPLPPGVQPLTDATVEIDHAARTIHVLDCSGVPVCFNTGRPRQRHALPIVEVEIPDHVAPNETFTLAVAGYGNVVVRAPARLPEPEDGFAAPRRPTMAIHVPPRQMAALDDCDAHIAVHAPPIERAPPLPAARAETVRDRLAWLEATASPRARTPQEESDDASGEEVRGIGAPLPFVHALFARRVGAVPLHKEVTSLQARRVTHVLAAPLRRRGARRAGSRRRGGTRRGSRQSGRRGRMPALLLPPPPPPPPLLLAAAAGLRCLQGAAKRAGASRAGQVGRWRTGPGGKRVGGVGRCCLWGAEAGGTGISPHMRGSRTRGRPARRPARLAARGCCRP